MAVNGTALASVIAGSVFLYAGIKGKSITQAVQYTIQGKSPAQSPTVATIADVTITDSGTGSSGGFASPGGNVNASGQTALREAAKAYGWDTGAEWQALNYVEMREAGYSATARNPSSGALGMAQALGHGNANTAGTLGNQYGGFGLTDAQAKQANSGNAYYQSVWMCNYIHATYGTPTKAAEHERANNWY